MKVYMTLAGASVVGQNDAHQHLTGLRIASDMVNSNLLQRARSGMSNRMDEDRVKGRASLGVAAAWTAVEIRLIADLGFALAEYGRDEEALTIFEGLAAVVPATVY